MAADRHRYRSLIIRGWIQRDAAQAPRRHFSGTRTAVHEVWGKYHNPEARVHRDTILPTGYGLHI